MQAQTLFVLGLVAGALVVFGIRAVSLEDAPHDTPQATEPAVDPAPMTHGGGPVSPSMPGPHEADGHAPHAEAEHASVTDHPPENAICPVMGNPVVPGIFVDYGDRRIGFCCEGCDELFLQDPEKYLKKVDAEIAARRAAEGAAPTEPEEGNEPEEALDPDRPPENTVCPVMGNPVDPTIWVDYEGRRIGFCCPGCDRLFLENPEKYLKKVDAELRERRER